jgi:histidinol dehydrogenase
MQKGLIKVWDFKELPSDWSKRQQADQKATQELQTDVQAIINQVKADGDRALVEFAQKFDKVELDARALRVRPAEFKEAYTKTTPQQISGLKFMQNKVSNFQKQLLTQTDIKTLSDGISVQTVLRPLESV